jgi:DNA-binding response OmpR family regulator
MHALIVDDNPHMVSIARRWLRQTGYEVTTSSDFLAGLHHLQQEHFDTVVVDVRLGDFNGLQLAILAHDRDPQAHLVVMSAWDDPVLQRDAAQCGARYLVKPFTASQLRTAMAHPTMPAANRRPSEETGPAHSLADRH